jgi:hypothetical protein
VSLPEKKEMVKSSRWRPIRLKKMKVEKLAFFFFFFFFFNSLQFS